MVRSNAFFQSSIKPALSLVVSFIVMIGIPQSLMADAAVNTGYFGNVAIKGYDPVAYFTEGKPMEGTEDHAIKWLGAKWRFATAEHKEMFAASPVKYAPQYGGHCATGMAIHGGLTKDIDPEAWAIIDGKLYLNYSKETQKLMTEGMATPEKADAKWEKYDEDTTTQ
ncbi:MAG: YHS domain-containing (seleno)protein [Arenicellales bacterium]|nr:YHS domain-containing (seleno)protein [Arenicellales bacterium]